MKGNGQKSIEDVDAPDSQGIIAEFWSFIRHNKKYWLIPILLIFILLGILIIFSGSGVAPFIYPLF